MPRLATAFVFAVNAERLAAFYEAGLGFAVTHREPGWIVMDAGGVEFAVHQIPQDIAKDIVIADPPQERTTGSTKLVFAVEDFAAARARLEAAGARFRDNPWDGATSRDFVDPEGNIFRIRQD